MSHTYIFNLEQDLSSDHLESRFKKYFLDIDNVFISNKIFLKVDILL